MPRISVLLSALNAESFLPKALDSIKFQTFEDWECIVTDDGSSDATRKILEGYSRPDPRFKVLTHDQPQGLTLSLIQSSQRAQGLFIARQDADDWSEPTRLERQMKLLDQKPELAAVGSRFAVHYPDGRYLDTVEGIVKPAAIGRLLWRRNPFAHGSMMFRRKVYDQLGGYRAPFRYAQDYDLLLRLSEVAPISAVDEVLYHHRLSTEGIGRMKSAQQSAYANLARQCAGCRKRGLTEDLCFSSFREPDAAAPPSRTADPILLHLIKSGQQKAAADYLARWRPVNADERTIKRGLSLLNACPAPIRRALHAVYRLWLLR